MKTLVTDERGYAARQEEIDAAILTSLAESPKTYDDLGRMLRSMGVGDAKSDERLQISYSSTGAICRAARNSLRWRGLIYDSWDLQQPYERPFRIYRKS